MTDFEKLCEAHKQIGELRAFVRLAKELLEKAEFENNVYETRKEIWLEHLGGTAHG